MIGLWEQQVRKTWKSVWEIKLQLCALKKRKQPSGEGLFPSEGKSMWKVRERREIMSPWDTRQEVQCGWREIKAKRCSYREDLSGRSWTNYIPRGGICLLSWKCGPSWKDSKPNVTSLYVGCRIPVAGWELSTEWMQEQRQRSLWETLQWIKQRPNKEYGLGVLTVAMASR